MKKALLILLSSILFVMAVNAGQKEEASVFLPFTTENDRWDHRWFTLLPNSNIYESIEVFSFDNEDFPNNLFVCVKLNFKYKEEQSIYFNNPHKAKKWHQHARYAEMKYSTAGNYGSPMDLELSFRDTIGNDIDIRFSCRNSELKDDGFTNDLRIQKYSAFTIVAYENYCIPEEVSVKIGEAQMNFNVEKDSSDFWKYKPIYSFNNQSFSIIALQINVFANDTLVRNFTGNTFNLAESNKENLFRTDHIGYKKYIEIRTDSLYQMLSYTYHNIDEYMKISFDPCFFSTETPEEYTYQEDKAFFSNFEITASNTSDKIIGKIMANKNPGTISAEWFLSEPEWLSDFRFVTDFSKLNNNYYRVIVVPLFN